MKDLAYYLNLNWRVNTQREDAHWLGYVNGLPGCLVTGSTANDARLNLYAALPSWIENSLRTGAIILEP